MPLTVITKDTKNSAFSFRLTENTVQFDVSQPDELPCCFQFQGAYVWLSIVTTTTTSIMYSQQDLKYHIKQLNC